MNMLARHTLLVLVLLSLAGCARQSPPQQGKTADPQFQAAINACRQKTQDFMFDESQPLRASYFKICMDQYGYEEKDYKYLWIDIIN